MAFQGTNRFNLPWTPNNRGWINFVVPPNQIPQPPNTETVRAPVFSRHFGRAWLAAALIQVLPSLNTTTLVDAGPPPDPPRKQTEWHNPRGPQFPVSLRTHTYNFIPSVQALTIPDGKSAFPEPRGPSYPVSLRTWLQKIPQAAQGLTIPDGKSTFPTVPPGPTYPISLRTWTSTVQPPAAVAQDPLRPVDFPNPQARRGAQSFIGQNLSQTTLVPAAPAAPIKPVLFPNPSQRPFPLAAQTYTVRLPAEEEAGGTPNTETLRVPVFTRLYAPSRLAALTAQPLLNLTIRLPVGQVQNPFVQHQWPTPQVRVFFYELRSWIRSSQIQLIGQDAFPSRQGDWPNPTLRVVYNGNRTWIHRTQTQLIGQDAFPSRQAEWPLPNPKPRYRQYIHGELTNPNLFPPAEVVVSTGQKEKRKWRRGSA